MLIKDNMKNLDKQNMFDAIKKMHKQITNSFSIMDASKIDKTSNYHNIIICGMGGSAIGADFVRTTLNNILSIPIYVNRSYDLPEWVSQNTLVILCSYSGNTEETISCFKLVMKLDVKPIIIASGGFLLNQAKKNKLNNIILPKGIQPRAAFGYSSSILILLLVKLDIINKSYLNILQKSADSLRILSEELSLIDQNNRSIKYAQKIKNKFPIIYGTPLTETIAVRIKGQFAENAKVLSSYNIIPEQNHNEIESFIDMKDGKYIVIWIQDRDDNKRNSKRIKITSKLLGDADNQIIISETGDHVIERMYKIIHMFDWVSYYLAILYGINPTPVKVIENLKILMK